MVEDHAGGRPAELRAILRQPRDAAPPGEQPAAGPAARRRSRAGALRRQHHRRASADSSTSRRRSHIEPSNADAGQTLALYGVARGPVPGAADDAAARPCATRSAAASTGCSIPIGYFLPFFANRAKSLGHRRQRSLAEPRSCIDNVEDSVLDLYSAARNGYLQRRRRVIELASQARREEWMWAGLRPRKRSPTDGDGRVSTPETIRHEDIRPTAPPYRTSDDRSCVRSPRPSSCATCAASTTVARSCAAYRSRSPRARSSACSARTAPARRRSSR